MTPVGYRSAVLGWKNIRVIFLREVRDQLRDRRTLFMITILPVLLYPMLGLGLVQMMLTFSEQRRTVVVLNAEDLPRAPAFLSESGVDSRWLEDSDDGSKLIVVTDRQPPTAPDKPAGHHQGPTRETLLKNARQLANHIQRSVAACTDDGIGHRRFAKRAAQNQQLAEDLSSLFGESGIHVLVLVPDGYAESIRTVRTRLRDSKKLPGLTGTPGLLVVRNSADDKSVVAFSRLRVALENWEFCLRDSIFKQASLPEKLQHPAGLQWVEVARGEQVAANVWSKLFPAMLVIMALTGAFYPAIDLGAGEKERGTMETLLISPARRVELVLGKFGTVMLFSVTSALMNLASMAITGQQMASAIGAGVADTISLDFPPVSALAWIVLLLLPLAALFSALCLALATFARSTKEGQYYLTPLLMVVMGLIMFCLSPAVELAPLYSVLPVINVALLLKGLLLTSVQTISLAAYTVPVLVSSIGYCFLALWWAIDLYNRENVLFREAEKFDLRVWVWQLLRSRDAVPAFPEAVFCFIGILLLQMIAMKFLQPDMAGPAEEVITGMLQLICIQQLVTIACPAVFMGLVLTTSLRATFRLRMPSLTALFSAIGLAVLVHPLSVELSHFLTEQAVFPELPEAIGRVQSLMTGNQPLWLLMLIFAVTPAICEELAFRGFVLSGLARGGRLAIAVVVSSIMFGIIHMIPQQAFNAALMGLLLGLVAVHSRSLFPAMAFHFCTNALALLYSRNALPVTADGLFFSRDNLDDIRYGASVLLICGVCVVWISSRMIRDLIREQKIRRRGEMERYVDSRTTATAM